MMYAKKCIRVYSLRKERELISKLKLGENEKISAILQDIMEDMFSLTDLQVTKVRVLELIIVLSRVAVDGGANFNKILQINTKFFYDINKFYTFEQLSSAAHATLKDFMKARRARNPQAEKIVNQIKQFILTNYRSDLTLEKIAKSVYLSPCYVSRVFREVQGITVRDYLTQVKIEKAKMLLQDPKYTICEISDWLGYKEPSYFSKVFRRKEGQTPSQFRQLG